jgi:uncharacterized protein YbaP (TraB family)
LLAAALVLATVDAAAADTSPLEEVVVTGEQPGPQLWHVHRDRGELWLFGTVEPLPKKITWRARQLDEVLTHTDVLVTVKPVHVGLARIVWIMLTKRSLFTMPKGKKLKDALPPDLYARFDHQRSLYTRDRDKWENYRPIIATLQLAGSAFEKAGLSDQLDVDEEVRKLARKHRVRFEELEVGRVQDILDILKNLPPATETRCVAATLSVIESHLPNYVARANAWATGDIEALKRLSNEPEIESCFDALQSDKTAEEMATRAGHEWDDTLRRHLDRGERSLAISSVRSILKEGGDLDRLRQEGYTVDPF